MVILSADSAGRPLHHPRTHC